ncbi:MAG: ABC transporter ATP-binding protein [Phycisphaerae bacterium]|nr:MAG: ABC transporter ATP-binding protein [Phycisphaerae bacterium]
MVELTEMTNWAVDLIGVRKRYRGGVDALRGVNIQVGQGEIFGLLGPNGAGKTTLVKIMMTVIRPSHALGTILGRPIGNSRKLARIGYLPESHRFPPYLTGAQLLDYYSALAKVPRKTRKTRSGELLERMGMSKWADTSISKYSKGMMQRLGLAQALMNDPDLIVLDEPTDGVDPMGRRDIRELLLDFKKQGKTVLINSHLLGELEMVCDRVSILVDGLVARQGTLKELTEQSKEYRVMVDGDLASLEAQIRSLGGRIITGGAMLRGHDSEKINALIDLLRQNRHPIESVEKRRFSLEDVFVKAMASATSVSDKAPVRASKVSQ